MKDLLTTVINPNGSPYARDPVGHKQIRDFDHLLQVLNHIMGQGPGFTEHQAQMGLVGVPMNVSQTDLCIWQFLIFYAGHARLAHGYTIWLCFFLGQ